APYLVPCHTVAGIGCFGDFVFGERGIETWPPRVRFKFCLRAKKLISASAAEINSLFVIVPILILVWCLGFGFTENLKLSGSQDLSPSVITQRHLLRHRSRLDFASDSRGLCIFRLADANT